MLTKYKFVLNYQDHLTKFVILKPLKIKTAEEVAQNLLDIFTFFGAPAIVQSDNGREFANKILKQLTLLWDGLKTVMENLDILKVKDQLNVLIKTSRICCQRG